MNELYEKSLKKLELDKVLELLAAHAGSEAAKQACRALIPLDDADDICALQKETTDACRLITLKGSPSLGGLRAPTAAAFSAPRSCFRSPAVSSLPAW